MFNRISNPLQPRSHHKRSPLNKDQLITQTSIRETACSTQLLETTPGPEYGGYSTPFTKKGICQRNLFSEPQTEFVLPSKHRSNDPIKQWKGLASLSQCMQPPDGLLTSP